MRIFGSIEFYIECILPFLYIIRFQTYWSFEPRSSTQGEDRHTGLWTFLDEIQFRTTFISSFFPLWCVFLAALSLKFIVCYIWTTHTHAHTHTSSFCHCVTSRCNFTIASRVSLRAPIMPKNASNKSCRALNFIQQIKWAHVAISPGVELAALKNCSVSNITMYWNGKVDSLQCSTLPKVPLISKNTSNKSRREFQSSII